MFKRKAFKDKTFNKNSSKIFKSIVGIDASQLYLYSMSHDVPTGLYTKWGFDSDMQKFKLDVSNIAILRTCSCLFTKKEAQKAELRASTQMEMNRKMTVPM